MSATDRATARAWRKRAAELREQAAAVAAGSVARRVLERRADGYDRDAARLEARAAESGR